MQKIVAQQIVAWARAYRRPFDTRDLAVVFDRVTVRSLGSACRWLERAGHLKQVDVITRGGPHGASIFRFQAVQRMRPDEPKRARARDPEAVLAELMAGRRYEDAPRETSPGPQPTRAPALNPCAYS